MLGGTQFFFPICNKMNILLGNITFQLLMIFPTSQTMWFSIHLIIYRKTSSPNRKPQMTLFKIQLLTIKCYLCTTMIRKFFNLQRLHSLCYHNSLKPQLQILQNLLIYCNGLKPQLQILQNLLIYCNGLKPQL